MLQEQVVARKIWDRWASSGLTTFGEEGYQPIEKLLVTVYVIVPVDETGYCIVRYNVKCCQASMGYLKPHHTRRLVRQAVLTLQDCVQVASRLPPFWKSRDSGTLIYIYFGLQR